MLSKIVFVITIIGFLVDTNALLRRRFNKLSVLTAIGAEPITKRWSSKNEQQAIPIVTVGQLDANNETQNSKKINTAIDTTLQNEVEETSDLEKENEDKDFAEDKKVRDSAVVEGASEADAEPEPLEDGGDADKKVIKEIEEDKDKQTKKKARGASKEEDENNVHIEKAELQSNKEPQETVEESENEIKKAENSESKKEKEIEKIAAGTSEVAKADSCSEAEEAADHAEENLEEAEEDINKIKAKKLEKESQKLKRKAEEEVNESDEEEQEDESED